MRGSIAFAILMACGDNYSLVVVPSPVDATAERDAPPARGTATVSIGGRRSGVRVIFQAPDSTVLNNVMTSLEGVANGPMEAGGYVTVIDPYGPVAGLTQVRTFADVQPGDQLELRDRDDVVGSSGSSNMTVAANGSPDPAVVRYQLTTQPGMPADMFTPGATIQMILERPPGVSTADFLVVGYDTNWEARTSSFALDVMLGESVDLRGYPEQPLASHSIDYFGIPATKTARITETLATTRGVLYTTTQDVGVADNSASSQMSQPVGVGAFDDLSYEGTTQTQTVRLFERRPYANSFVINAWGRLLPEVTTCPTFDAASRQLSWTEPFTSRGPNFVLATIKNFDVEWTMIAPVRGSVAVFPKPVNFSTRFPYVFKKLERAFTPGGHEALRAASFWPYATLVDGGGALGFVVSSEIRADRCANL